MRCPTCEAFCPDAFRLAAHMSEQHPIRNPGAFPSIMASLREFEPMKRQHMRGGFPGLDIDAIHRNPKYGPKKR